MGGSDVVVDLRRPGSVIDVRESDPRGAEVGDPEVPRSAAARVRLALDLQLEALLATLAATGGADPGELPGPGPDRPDTAGHRRLADDVEAAYALAAAAAGLGAGLPPALGRAAAGADARDDVRRRYEALGGVLRSVLDDGHGELPHEAQRTLTRAARICRSRVAELSAEPSPTPSPQARGTGVAYATSLASVPALPSGGNGEFRDLDSSDSTYLPGELLG